MSAPFFPKINSAVMKRLRANAQEWTSIEYEPLPNTFLGRLRGFLCLDKPKRRSLAPSNGAPEGKP